MTYTPTTWKRGNPPCNIYGCLNTMETGIYHALSHSGGIRNVAEFAARSPGSPTAGIQEAIDDLPATGGMVFIPAGTHRVTSPITVSSRFITIVGAGKSATIVLVNGDLNDFLLSYEGSPVPDQLERLHLAHLSLHGNYRAFVADGLKLSEGAVLDLFNVRIRDFDGYGLYIEDWQDSNFIDMEVRECGNLANTKPQVNITEGVDYGVNNLRFWGCRFENNYYTNVRIHGTGPLVTREVSFTVCKFHGLLAGPTYNNMEIHQADHIALVGGMFAWAGPTDVLVTGGARFVKILQNRFFCLGIGQVYAIDFEDAVYSIADDNYFGGALAPDIRIQAASNDILIGAGNRSESGFSVSDLGTNNLHLYKLMVDADGRVGIGTAVPAVSAMLEIGGTTGAVLLPRLTAIQQTALTAVNGMVIYNTDNNRLEAYENGAWVDL